MAEPAQRRVADDGGRYYEHPTRTTLTGEPRRYVSVTTALDVLSKEALIFWATKLSARRAMENLPRLINAARIEPCGDTYKRDGSRCRKCSACLAHWVETFHLGEKTRRAREGSAVHDVIEWWSKTGEIHYDPSAHLYEHDGETRQVTREAIQPYLDRFQEWVTDYGITPDSFLVCEATVWHHDDGWAGTTDGVLMIEPRTVKAAKLCARIHASSGKVGAALDEPAVVSLDNKTREGDGKAFYPEFSLQTGGAYRHAQTITPKLGMIETEMLRTDGAVILQLRPDGYTFEPVASGQREYQAFLHALRLYEWRSTYGDASVQVKTFPVPEGWEYAPKTYERATMPTGKLCGCPACDDPHDPDCMFAGKLSRQPGPHTREVTADGDPVPPRKAARKRAPAKKTTPRSSRASGTPGGTLGSIRGYDASATDKPDDDGIPF